MPVLKKAYKIRLFPTDADENYFWRATGTARWAYNWTVNKEKKEYAQTGKFIQVGLLRKEFNQLKHTDKFDWILDVSNNIPKQAIKDACNAYKKFFKHQASIPIFKSKKKSRPSFYIDTSKIKFSTKSIYIEKLGWVKTSEQLPINVKCYNPRIVYDNKYWFITVAFDVEYLDIQHTEESIGIDVGVKNLAVCSNGMIFKNINKTVRVKKVKKKLRRMQRQVSRKYEMGNKHNTKKYQKTKNIIKLEKQIKLQFRRLANIRNNHIHQATTMIVKTKPSRIVVETLNIKGMMKNRHLAKAIAEQCLYTFQTYLQYKCTQYGIEYVKADRFYPSSKTCSNCGSIKHDLKLSDRTYICPKCGFIGDRDFNASVNLSRYKLVV